MTDRSELLLADILEGPAALTRLIEAYAAHEGPLAGAGERPARVVFTGLGSSRYAARSVESTFRRGGIATSVEYASIAEPFPPAADLVLVAISASGGTREVVEAARRHRGIGRVIAVTNREDSALAREADAVLPLFAGEERSGVATRTHRGTVAVLGLLAGHWGNGSAVTGDDLRPCVAALARVLDTKDDWLADASDRFDGAPAIDVLADAADLGLAEQAALMLRECPRLPAVSHDTGDWLHTAVYLAFPGHRALLFAGAEADTDVVRTIERRGGATVVVGPPIDGGAQAIDIDLSGGPLERTIVGSVVAELLSAELWRRTSALDKGA